MSDRNANEQWFDSADDAAKQDDVAQDTDALRDQDLDQAAGGGRVFAAKTGDAAANARKSVFKNDKPESDAHAR